MEIFYKGAHTIKVKVTSTYKGEHHSMKKITVISLVIMTILLTLGLTVYSLLARMNHIEINKSNEALGITIEPEIINYEAIIDPDIMEIEYIEPKYSKRNDIVNIVLLGLDGTDYDKTRSDSIIILTIDFMNKKIKLSSLMRDMYVAIEGYGNTKLNHAYSYGGAPLAIKTINQNFDTNIRDYIAINFEALEKIIDIVGGVYIDLKQEEIIEINSSKDEDVEITEAGEHLLNGKQALAYSRIRYVGNGDFERTERQRKVLYQIFVKAKDMKIDEVLNLASEILPLVETSMDKKTILTMVTDYFKSDKMTFDEERFPIDGYHWNNITDGIYYLKFDTDITKTQIVDYILNDIKPIAKE